MKHHAIIPARAGSKSIINKNLQMVGKKRLVYRAIDSALESGIFSQIILSTDIDCLIDEFQTGEIILNRRNPSLCTDTALMKDVILSILNGYNIDNDDYFWLLQPTTPFRTKDDYHNIISLIEKQEATNIISLSSVGSFHPMRMYTVVGGEAHRLRYVSYQNKQDLPVQYIRSGHFYVSKVEKFRKSGEFDCKPCTAYIVPEDRSINIDSERELWYAKVDAERLGL